MDTPNDDAIVVEPLSPAVGLEVKGASLDDYDDNIAAMIRDLWQVGGALLFRSCPRPGRSVSVMARALTSDGLPSVTRNEPGSTEWRMVGAEHTDQPPIACIVCARPGMELPALWLAGMEAAADTLRLTGSALLRDAIDLHFAHSLDGPMLPVIQHHPQTGAPILYPPPRRAAGQDAAGLAIVRMVEEPRFCYRHVWQPGDVLAWDPRCVRSRWESAPASDVELVTVDRSNAPPPPAVDILPL